AAPTRKFTVVLSTPVNATLVQKTATITIRPSGATAVASPKISAPPDGIAAEADGYLDLPVTLSAPATKSVTVSYATANSTAGSGTVCNATYVGVPNPGSTAGTLTFTPGQTLQFVRVDLLKCGLSAFVSFTFNLSAATNATIVRPSTRIGIVGDPTAGSTAPGLYARSAYVDTLAGSVNVPVLLGGPAGAASNSTVTVSYATANGTAFSGTVCNATYVGVPNPGSTAGTLTFTPGQTLQFVRVDLLNCNLASPGTFTFHLSAPTNATIQRATATITIVH